jgi:hypothetical protein
VRTRASIDGNWGAPWKPILTIVQLKWLLWIDALNFFHD